MKIGDILINKGEKKKFTLGNISGTAFCGRNTGNNERSVGVFGAVRCPYYGELLITEDHLHPL